MPFMQPLSLENLRSREQKNQVSNCLTVRAIKWKVSLSNFISYGWCDETEMGKLESLMAMAQNRMGEVEDREATPEEESMFIMASLM